MSALTVNDARDLQGASMLDSSGTKIGKVADVYVDNDTQTPEWALVHTGLFGGRGSFVPLAQAHLADRGLTVPYSKDQVKDAPNAEPDGELSQDEEARLYSHYGLNYTESTSDSGLPTAGTPAAAAPARGHDVDEAMTRSEERLHVGTEKVETGRARLRKVIVTEQQQVTVPVSHEEVRIEREPITEANRGQAMSGGDLTEEEHEVTLHAERPVVEKETVPVERVRLATETVNEEQKVTEQVRKEQIEDPQTDLRGDKR